jgi:outer membrane protein assembly factor BamB
MGFVAAATFVLSTWPADASDWPRFRGPNGSGISPDRASSPVHWSDSENLRWKAPLPGPGSSSPIVVGDKVVVTCWTGYGLNREEPGDPERLKRVVLCLDRRDGQVVWSDEVPATQPEDLYEGMLTEHGYASHTPVSDGERIFVFCGKSGALGYDFSGRRLWQIGLGTESGLNGWGSAASPIVYKDLVIVTAAAESEAIVALDKSSGREVWRKEATGLEGTWGTPVLSELDGGRVDLVVAVPTEVWGFDPETGKLRWYCQSFESNSVCASAIVEQGIVYLLGGRSGGSIAVRAGGEGDVTKSHVLWSGRDAARVGTPVYEKGHLFWIDRGIARCIEADTGGLLYEERLGVTASARSPRAPGGAQALEDARRETERRSGGSAPRRRVRTGRDYSSPVVADGKIYYVTRSGESFVLALDPQYRLLARNRFESDRSEFSATPALSDGELFIRSNTTLYCVSSALQEAAGN